MRLARETSAASSTGAEKYLDELLIWRELAYSFCFYRHDLGRLSSIPPWAIQTLSKHEKDLRTELLSWETMARGRTEDSLWDSAQRSLLIHGELHNNVRMTWGKAILNWTPNAKQALKRMIDLNHRYALDGRDPASYGGILWCLGQFDRPFSPEKPIFGSVRTRPTQQHLKRLDADAYRNKVSRSSLRSRPSVAVVGAGLSGLMCARTLKDHGYDVKVFEKSRGLGGRMATRRADGDLSFDHGAQYFTARDARFRRYVDSWVQDGVVQPWQGRIVVLENGSVKQEKHRPENQEPNKQSIERFVATPRMNAICKHLAKDLDVSLRTLVAPPKRIANQWSLFDENDAEIGRFNCVVIASPAGQAAKLLQASPELKGQARKAEMTGCWAVMLAFDRSLSLNFDAAFVHQSPLSWIACNNSKPSRTCDLQSWTLHVSPQWSQDHIEDSPDEVKSLLLREFWRAVGTPPTEPVYTNAHRWRYALPSKPLAVRSLFDPSMQIGACGDWCGGPRVEGAFLSGMAIAGQVMGHTNSTSLVSQHG